MSLLGNETFLRARASIACMASDRSLFYNLPPRTPRNVWEAVSARYHTFVDTLQPELLAEFQHLQAQDAEKP